MVDSERTGFTAEWSGHELHTQSSPHVFRLKPTFVGSTVKQLNISKSLEAPKNSLVEAHFVRLNFKKIKNNSPMFTMLVA